MQSSRKESIGTGSNKVYTQHLRYLNTSNDNGSPREAFLDDMLVYMELWRQDGYSIVIM